MPRGVITNLIVASLLGSWLLALGGCVIVVGDDWEYSSMAPTVKTTRSMAVAHVDHKPLQVATENGEISVTAYDGTEVQVVSKLRAGSQERLDQTLVTAQRDGDGVLKIAVRWPDDKRKSNDGCSFEIKIPNVERMKLESSNGAVRVKGLGGPAELITSNAEIVATDHAGEVRADTSNGKIEFKNVLGARAGTSNGEIVIRLAATATGPVKADTSNGSITLGIGPAFAGTLVADTSNGGVNFESTRATSRIKMSKDHGEWTFGPGSKSELDTSNGSITVNDAKPDVP